MKPTIRYPANDRTTPAMTNGKEVLKCSPKDVSAICDDKGEITSATAPPAHTVPTIISIFTPEFTTKLTASGIISAQVAHEEPIV